MAKEDELVTYRIHTEEGVTMLNNAAKRCGEQARLHSSQPVARIYHAVAKGLEMVAVMAPVEISEPTIQAGITTAALSSRPLTRAEQDDAMKQIRRGITHVQTEERKLLASKAHPAPCRRLSPQRLA